MSRCTTLWQGYSASTYLQPGGRTSSARGFVQRNWSSGWSNSMKEIGGGKKIEEACFHVLSTQEMSLEECTLCSPSEGKKIYVKVKEGWNWSDKPFHFEKAVFPIVICHWRALHRIGIQKIVPWVWWDENFLWGISRRAFGQHFHAACPFLGSTMSILFVRGPFNHNNNGNL